MTREQFISREIATWGEDYVFDLFERGYVAVQLSNGSRIRWTWMVPTSPTYPGLTNAPDCATVGFGSDGGFTPVFPTSRASRT
jgi:hypothetical protein